MEDATYTTIAELFKALLMGDVPQAAAIMHIDNDNVAMYNGNELVYCAMPHEALEQALKVLGISCEGV